MTQHEVDRWYKTVAWISVRDYVIRKNPICQHIDEDGKRCDQASNVVHHLISPLDRWDLRADWSNLTAVCARHHQGGQRGETQGYRYAPTYGPDPGYGCEQEIYIHEVKSVDLVPTGKDGKQFSSGGPSDATLDAMLADVADVTYEEACDFAETSNARAFCFAMKNGQPFDRKMFPSDQELAYLAKCQAKWSGRDGWL
jgi:hypothetical protein